LVKPLGGAGDELVPFGESESISLTNMRRMLPFILGATAGAVDVTTFLALGGLFSAHITGNLVVLAAHYITGRFGEVGPLLSVPMFVAVLWIVTLAFVRKPTPIARRGLLILQAVLLAVFLGFGIAFGPFQNPDSGMAVFVGMMAVAAMSTQNALVRLALPGAPSTAVMTTNVAQCTVDLARLVSGHISPDPRGEVQRRADLTLAAVFGFMIGLVLGALVEIRFGFWSVTFPLLLAVIAIPLGESWPITK
jgi:uncharacterized membrane protein YoaK (UPF0700 family)